MAKSKNANDREAKRVQIIAVHRFNGDWRTKANELGVPVSTAYRWVSLGKISDRRGVKMFSKVTEEHRQYMASLIEGMYG